MTLYYIVREDTNMRALNRDNVAVIVEGSVQDANQVALYYNEISRADLVRADSTHAMA